MVNNKIYLSLWDLIIDYILKNIVLIWDIIKTCIVELLLVLEIKYKKLRHFKNNDS